MRSTFVRWYRKHDNSLNRQSILPFFFILAAEWFTIYPIAWYMSRSSIHKAILGEVCSLWVQEAPGRAGGQNALVKMPQFSRQLVRRDGPCESSSMNQGVSGAVFVASGYTGRTYLRCLAIPAAKTGEAAA